MNIQHALAESPHTMPFVRLNSLVDVEEVPPGKRWTVRVVPPECADEDHGRVSRFAPLGRALLGARVGSVVDVPQRGGGRSRVQVVAARLAE